MDGSSEGRAEYDYIVVGGGAAGCVVANRLSADASIRVCLLEAGPEDDNLFIRMPAGFIKILGNASYTWTFPTEPTSQTAGRPVYLVQGRTLGGGTSVNGMAYNRGQRADFDGWAAAGNPGWSYDELLPVFRDLERRDGGDPAYRGGTGPLTVTNVQWNDGVSPAFIESAVERGIPKNQDTNGARQEGVCFSQVNISRGRRVSSSSAFLRPVRQRRNLRVITGAMATKVLFDGKRASGIRYTKGGAISDIHAASEVIICCGSINTPRLLQVSGVGDRDHLAAISVPAVHHLPGVGENFQDHYMVQLVARGRHYTSINQVARAPRLWWEAFRWFLRKPSVLGLPVALVHYFMRSGLEEGDADIQGIFTPASHMTGDEGHLDKQSGMTCAVWQHRPRSRGFVRAVSANIDDAPVVQPNYLADEHDRKVLIEACRRSRQIMQGKRMANFFDAEISPGEKVQTDAQWLDFIRATGSTVYHPVGTSKMGPVTDPMSVVDATLRVHGLEGIRVVDASIMPTLTSGNTAAAAMVIGEMGARAILAARKEYIACLRTL